MEEKGVRRVVIMAMVVLVLFSGHATASFKGCYAGCFVECMVETNKFFNCAFKCLKQCLFKSASADSLDYCNLGCSVDKCVEFSQDSEKMESCVNDCSSNVCRIEE